MFQLKLFTPLAVVAGLLASVASPAPVSAQQAYAYQNVFDDATGLSFTPAGGYWNVDATPSIAASPGSGGNSLNYNNGVDFSGDNPGAVRTPTIDMTGVTTATMTFNCWYNTETGPTYDQKFIRIFNATTGGQVYQQQIYQGAPAPGNCSALSTWHQHSFSPFPAAALNIPIQIEFSFDPIDAGGNGGQGWFIDDLEIIADDKAPPEAIDDLAASNPQLSTVDLDWTAPADNDISGQAQSYDLRYATAPITAATWATATQVTGEPSPGPPGTPHSLTITGLNPGTQYWFAIRSSDFASPVVNVSALSNVATTTTLALPPVGGGSATEAAKPPKDRYNACTAGTEAAPAGLAALAALIGLAAAFRTVLKK